MRPALLLLALLTACDQVQTSVKEAAVQLTFCDQLPKKYPPVAAPLQDPAELLKCMHPLVKLDKSEAATSINSCKDPENWEITQLVTMEWNGVLKRQRAQVKVDYRVVGGYLSVRKTRIFDEAVIDGSKDCTNEQWTQSDDKVIDVHSIVNGQ